MTGSIDDGAPEGTPTNGQGGPPQTPPPAPPPTWQGPSQAEWEATTASQKQLTDLLATMTGAKPDTPAGDDDEEDDDDPDAPSPRTAQDRTKPPSWDDIDRITSAMKKAARGERRMRQRVAEWRDADAQRQEQLTRAQQLAEAETKARQAAEQMFRPATIRAASVPALLRAEARADRVDALFSMIDQGSLGIEGDAVTGLDDQVTALKTRFPEWFEKPTPPPTDTPPEPPRPPAPRATTGNYPPANSDAPATSAQRMAAQILGGTP